MPTGDDYATGMWYAAWILVERGFKSNFRNPRWVGVIYRNLEKKCYLWDKDSNYPSTFHGDCYGDHVCSTKLQST